MRATESVLGGGSSGESALDPPHAGGIRVERVRRLPRLPPPSSPRRHGEPEGTPPTTTPRPVQVAPPPAAGQGGGYRRRRAPPAASPSRPPPTPRPPGPRPYHPANRVLPLVPVPGASSAERRLRWVCLGGVLGGRVAAHHRGGGVPQQVLHVQLPAPPSRSPVAKVWRRRWGLACTPGHRPSRAKRVPVGYPDLRGSFAHLA